MALGSEQYVIETFMMQESLAHREVSKLGYDVTWFKAQEEFRTRHGRRIVTTSAFPSYLFVAFDVLHDKWQRILKARGVKSILGSTPERPKALPAGALEEIRVRLTEPFSREVEPVEQRPQIIIREGDTVLVNMGADRPVLGICKLNDKERVRVLMEYMGGAREAVLPLSRVALAPENHLANTSLLS